MKPCNLPKVPFIDMRRHYAGVESVVEPAIGGVFNSGIFILGPEVSAFEQEFAAYCGSAYAVGVSSGTDALFLALHAVGIGPEDEVITVANTAVPTVTAISMTGATPRFVDIDPHTLLMDPARLEEAVTPKTKAVIPVHLFGQCVDMAPVLAFAARHKCMVIEDACQAHGAEYKGKRAGSMGDFGCFSFYPTKNLGAFGDGGMIVTNHREKADLIRRLRNYGQVDRYYHQEKGYNCRLDELQAAILRAKLPYLDRWSERRREIAMTYSNGFNRDLLTIPKVHPEGRHVYHLYVVRVKAREAFRAYLEKLGVQTLIHYPVPVHQQAAYVEFKATHLPVTETCAREIVSIPLYPELDDHEVDFIIRAVNGFQS